MQHLYGMKLEKKLICSQILAMLYMYIKASNFLTVVNPGVNRNTKWCPLGSSSDMAENFGATIRFPKGFKDVPLTHKQCR